VREGDHIEIDLFLKKIDLLVDETTLLKRKKTLKPLQKSLSGVLARYAKTVGQANLGAVQK
jgi:dihydroxy-acid dehydratase